ncbi:glutamate racemase [Desulfurella sp.]|uniref:glutamate racemase n=1 Tax=Desulfurella sp. TaxID=1962857 RepID=UPI0025C59614|nr:glutamate racemase [Desulfurella sp.]
MIGIFDSGVGGLTVIKPLIKYFKSDIIYLGDTARVPYGNKSKETVIKYSIENTKFLLSKGVDFIIVACNTASSLAIDTLRSIFNVPIYGVVESTAKVACQFDSIAVIGTKATIESNAYEKTIKMFNQNASVQQKACPLFVPLIEEGLIDDDITKLVAKRYLNGIQAQALVLGCTHYPLIKHIIKEIVPNAQIIDSGTSIINTIDKNMLKGSGKIEFYATDSPENFSKIGKLFLGENFNGVKLVDLEEL